VGLFACAIALLALATAALAGEISPGPPRPLGVAGAVALFLLGAACAHLFLRYGLARLVLDDRGFRIEGPFHRGPEVRWDGVVSWRTVRPGPGPRALRILHDGRRLSLPLVFEDGHLLEVGLAQRHFPHI
jgi:hypothetical protein